MTEVAIGVRSVSLGGGIKTLGDGVQTGGGSEGDSGGNNTVGGVREGSITTKVVGVSGPLAVVVSEVSVSVSEVAVGVRSVSLGGGIKALGDGVRARGMTDRKTVGIATKIVGISLSISGPLAVVVGNGKSSLGHGVKTLGDGVQTSGRTEGNTSVGDAMGIPVGVREHSCSVVAVEGISLGLDGRNEGSLRDMPLKICVIEKNILTTHSEERLEHVAASLLTQTENTDFDGGGAFIVTGRAGTHQGGMREKGVESGIAGKYELVLTSARKPVMILLIIEGSMKRCSY